MNSTDTYFQSLKSSIPLTKKEESTSSQEELIRCNLRLVISIAKKYQGRGLDFEDLIQEGNIGLIKASQRFDPKKECKFSTYATWWIKQSILQALVDRGTTIRTPAYIDGKLNKLKTAQNELYKKLGRKGSIKEISNFLNLPVSEIENIFSIQNTKQSVSIDSLTEEYNGYDFLEDLSSLSPIESLMIDNKKNNINLVLRTLSEREKTVIISRFGLNNQDPESLKEIGKRFNITQERIRQIEARALKKMAKMCKTKFKELF